MSAFDYFGGLYDAAFKPRLLLTLVRDHLPDQNHPFSNHSVVSKVVSLIKTHRLLSESFTDSMDPKQVEAWKSAVTTWVERVLDLLDSPVSDKRWAGISLLGVTCQECSPVRFLESFILWFHKLLPFLQSPEDSSLVRVAAFASMSDMFARLSGFPRFKKDGTSCAVKVIQPVLKLLSDFNSEAIWEGVVHLLCTIITSFPFSIKHHYDSVESAIASKLLSGAFSPDMSKKLAHCLALLPKSRADEESWSVMLQKFLVVINNQLNFAFQGLEEETVRNEVTRLLVPPGKHPPSPLGGYILAKEASNRATKRSEQSLVPSVSILMIGCCTMLTNSYPCKVHVPVRPLLALVERILMANGSLPQMSFLFMTAKQQEDICSELPPLHLCSLELLAAIIKAMGSQLLPHAGSISRIISKYFKTCALPELRIKFYSVTRTLLLSMGVGMALYLAQEVISNAFADLGTIENKSGGTLNGSNSNVSTGALPPPSHRKRKHSSTTGFLQDHDDGGGLGVEVPKNCPLAPISLRIAALEALEAVITVAGSLRSEPWRSKVDNLLIVVAMDSFKEGSASDEISVFQQSEVAATATDLQLAALRALLASFLSFARVRPPHLSQGLDLFRRGKLQTGTKVADFCVHALLTLEVLIHPRGLPLPNNNSFGEAQHNFRDEQVDRSNRTPFGLQQAGYDASDTDDDLCARWMENATETDDVSLPKNMEHIQETSEAIRDNNPNVLSGSQHNQEPSEAIRDNNPNVLSGSQHTQEPSEAIRDNNPSVLSAHPTSGTTVQERNEIVTPEDATNADVEMRVAEDEIIPKSDKPVESAVQSQEPVSYTTSIPVAEAREAVATEIASERIISDSTMPHNEGRSHMESGQGSSANKGYESSTGLLKRTSDTIMIQESAFKLDHGDSPADEDDVFPEIVDADPDSDSE